MTLDMDTNPIDSFLSTDIDTSDTDPGPNYELLKWNCVSDPDQAPGRLAFLMSERPWSEISNRKSSVWDL